MPDLFRQTSANGAQRSVALRGTVKVTNSGVRAVTEAYGSSLVIDPEVVIGTAKEGDPCLVVYDELNRPWLIAGQPEIASMATSVLVPKGAWEANVAYDADSVVWHRENDPLMTVEYFASADVAAGIEPPALPWKPLINAFEPDATVIPTPTIDFTYAMDGTTAHQVNFTATTNGASPTFDWSFGDTVNGTGVSPSHVYATARDYSVHVTVTANGEATHTVHKIITVT